MQKIKLIDVAKLKFIVEPRYYFYGWSKSPVILARESAAKALLKAQKLLPPGYKFKIWDCQRPRSVQIAMTKCFRKRLKILYPESTLKEFKKLVEHYAGKTPPPLKMERLDTHRNGGSFDLTIIKRNGDELFMGTDHDNLTPKAATDYFENKKKLMLLDKEARKNRRLLSKVLIKAGFINYKGEWWHWSWEK